MLSIGSRCNAWGSENSFSLKPVLGYNFLSFQIGFLFKMSGTIIWMLVIEPKMTIGIDDCRAQKNGHQNIPCLYYG